MQTIKKIIGVSTAFLTMGVYAETPQPQEQAPARSNAWYIGGGRVDIDSQIASEQGIGDSATYIKVGWVGQNKNFVYGAGISYLDYSDNRSFNQQVESNWGDRSTESSDASASAFFGEGGYTFMPSKYVGIDMLAGMELIWRSERGIGNCSDCYEEDIDVDSGIYVSPRLRLIADGFTFSISYQHYLSGDLGGTPLVTLGWTY
ncbi:porin family protein [Teredinibacter sp. KSP-S5-2]|uniref:porin family protein n=1 Tax=Teredinibacter sp. KSP-S5-2 TaxID=3034506 RepID=UPI00293432B0|nr:porin family protein [Teredinibacter sp. KSP-S5-2]WNO08776.1 porin family protein [Teredinibacter sp. KSP-S5-2]